MSDHNPTKSGFRPGWERVWEGSDMWAPHEAAVRLREQFRAAGVRVTIDLDEAGEAKHE